MPELRGNEGAPLKEKPQSLKDVVSEIESLTHEIICNTMRIGNELAEGDIPLDVGPLPDNAGMGIITRLSIVRSVLRETLSTTHKTLDRL